MGITNNDGIRKNIRVHRLVAEAFIPNPLNKPQVNHLDGNKLNNHYTNLEWATASENAKHAFALGLSSNDKGFNDSQSIQIVYIDNNAIMHVFGSVRSASRKLGIIARKITKKCIHNQRIIDDDFPIELMYDTFIYFYNIKNKCNEYRQVIFEYE